MRTSIGLGLFLLATTPAWAATGETAASRVFAMASPSVVVVDAIDNTGKIIAQGSGVVIAKDVVVSNCHVFEDRRTNVASVMYRGRQLPATLRYADVEHDLCSFTVNHLAAPPIAMRNTSDLKVGEDAYAIGAPEGFDVTLSNGIISSLRKIPGGTVIQMTTPISPGSSGGGLFDSQGRLIGITSYYAKEGQQLNFALPVAWIKALPQRGMTAKELAQRPPQSDTEFRQGVQAEWGGDYATALAIFRRLAKHGHAGAQSELGWKYSVWEGVPQDYVKAVYWLTKAATQGDAVAQNNLGAIYAAGHGVPQDYGKAIYWYRKAAAQGRAGAQNNLGALYYNGNGVLQDYATAVYWFRKGANQGYSGAQYDLGLAYANGHGVPQGDATAAHWYREAATQGDAGAQTNLGVAYELGKGVPQDYAKAVYWLTKAATQGLARAQYNLALMYYDGKDVPQAYTKAAHWFQKAAVQGVAEAQLNLGGMYFTGQGVPQDYREAAYWHLHAAEQGNLASQVAMGATYFYGKGVSQDYTQAAKWFILAKAQGSDDASHLLTSTEQKMTPSQIVEAQRLAREWWATHHRQTENGH